MIQMGVRMSREGEATYRYAAVLVHLQTRTVHGRGRSEVQCLHISLHNQHFLTHPVDSASKMTEPSNLVSSLPPTSSLT